MNLLCHVGITMRILEKLPISMIHYSPGHTSPNAANKANKSATVTMPSPVMSSGHAFASCSNAQLEVRRPHCTWTAETCSCFIRTVAIAAARATRPADQGWSGSGGLSNAHNRLNPKAIWRAAAVGTSSNPHSLPLMNL